MRGIERINVIHCRKVLLKESNVGLRDKEMKSCRNLARLTPLFRRHETVNS